MSRSMKKNEGMPHGAAFRPTTWVAVGVLLCGTCLPATALAGNKLSKKQLRAERAAAVADSLAFEEARTAARRDYFYFAGLQNRVSSGRLQSSFELMKHAAEVDSTSAAVRFALAEYYERIGNKQLALNHYAAAARRDTSNLWYGIKEAQLLQQLERPQEAIAGYERLLRAHPEDMQLCDRLAELYVSVDSLQRCVRLLDHVEAVEGIDPQLTMKKFYLYMQIGEPDSAFAVTQRLVDRFPYEANYRIVQGDLLLKAGRIDEAKANYDEANRLDADNAALWLSLANYHAVMGEQAQADSMMRAALTHPQLDIETKIDLLTDYLKNSLQQRANAPEGEDDVASLTTIDTLFAVVSAQHPTAAEPYVLHAQYLSAIGQDSLALLRYRDAIDLQPAEADYWTAYLRLLLQTDDNVKLRREADEALQYHPNLLLAYLAKSQSYVAEDKYEDARGCYRSALEHTPAYQTQTISALYGYIGDLFQQEARLDSTYAYYDLALKYNGENTEVLNNYSYFLSLEGKDLDKAERMISTVVRLKPDVAIYLDTYAWVYFKQGNFVLAKFYQKRAIDSAGEEVSATLLEHYGDILSCSGDKEGALEYWQRAAALPDNDSPTLDEKIRTGAYVDEPFDPNNIR